MRRSIDLTIIPGNPHVLIGRNAVILHRLRLNCRGILHKVRFHRVVALKWWFGSWRIEHCRWMEVNVFGFIIRLGFDFWGSEVSTIGSESSLHNVGWLGRDIVFDNFSSQLDAVADIFALVESVWVYAIVPRIFLIFLHFVPGVALCLLLHFPHWNFVSFDRVESSKGKRVIDDIFRLFAVSLHSAFICMVVLLVLGYLSGRVGQV